MQNDLERKIQERAHQLWEAYGRPEGREHEHWFEAERQVRSEEAASATRVDLSGDDSPAAEPEIPADPLRNPDLVQPGSDPEYPATPGPQEMPADRSPQPEIPAESGISEAPAPAPGAADTARKRSRNSGDAAMAKTVNVVGPASDAGTISPGGADSARKRSAVKKSGKGKGSEASV